VYGYRCGETEKIIQGFVPNFPDPSAEAGAANKWVSQESVRFRAFLGVQIRADSASFVQDVDKNVQETTENAVAADSFEV